MATNSYPEPDFGKPPKPCASEREPTGVHDDGDRFLVYFVCLTIFLFVLAFAWGHISQIQMGSRAENAMWMGMLAAGLGLACWYAAYDAT